MEFDIPELIEFLKKLEQLDVLTLTDDDDELEQAVAEVYSEY